MVVTFLYFRLLTQRQDKSVETDSVNYWAALQSQLGYCAALAQNSYVFFNTIHIKCKIDSKTLTYFFNNNNNLSK